ncbi:hypothetical protein HU200_061529 [Digitaria exilis]|uniref:Myb/SANT-like DNA-binding domain-containing protein n=1 Tax=Digitaria exilis TaxID=1010633 RepID=A0A835A814_9POAL|nr:hypothetical protein HU200_061529 [Digitaria exilis]
MHPCPLSFPSRNKLRAADDFAPGITSEPPGHPSPRSGFAYLTTAPHHDSAPPVIETLPPRDTAGVRGPRRWRCLWRGTAAPGRGGTTRPRPCSRARKRQPATARHPPPRSRPREPHRHHHHSRRGRWPNPHPENPNRPPPIPRPASSPYPPPPPPPPPPSLLRPTTPHPPPARSRSRSEISLVPRMMAAGAYDDADDPPPSRRSALKKSAPAQPWSDVETMHLIDAYDERWTALGRGQLKAQQWEEVAEDVASRCAATPGVVVQRKTGTQCRHKLEKLRKRYRTEAARPVTSLWTFFRRMDQLERGPLAAAASSAYPPASGSPPAAASDEEEEEEDEEEEEENDAEEEEPVHRNNNTRSINGIIREFGTGLAPRHPQLQMLQQQQQQQPPSSINPSTAPPRKRVAYEAFQAKAAAAAAAAVAADKAKEEEEVELVRRPSRPAGGGASSQLSAVLRDFSEGVMRLERRRMEMQWEIERGWQEVEARHTKMLQDAQRKIRDTIAASCALPPKKARRDYGDS